MISGNIESGGVETYLKDVYERINMNDLSIDVLVPGEIKYDPYADFFRKLGCKLIVCKIPQNNKMRYISLYKAVLQHLNRYKYDLIHVNTGNVTIQAVVLAAAKWKKVPIRISHSHGTVYTGGRLHETIKKAMRNYINRNATIKLACSYLAAESLFGKSHASEVIIAKNGINAENYRFDFKVRDRVRTDNGWNDKFIIGSVGRLAPEKNYSFILKVFKEILLLNEDCILVLVGDGEEKKRLKEEAVKLEIVNKVQFLGVRRDVPSVMQGYDVFVLASKREALGIVNIEAQATGLSCIISDAIPKEVDVTGNVTFLSLNDSYRKWAEVILRASDNDKRKDCSCIVKEHGFNLSDSYKVIEDIYRFNIH